MSDTSGVDKTNSMDEIAETNDYTRQIDGLDTGVADKVKSIIFDQLCLHLRTPSRKRPEDIKHADQLDSFLMADELDRIESVMAIEDSFDIDVTDDEMYRWQTVGDIINYLLFSISGRTR
jgi:acyl carrier protein